MQYLSKKDLIHVIDQAMAICRKYVAFDRARILVIKHIYLSIEVPSRRRWRVVLPSRLSLLLKPLSKVEEYNFSHCVVPFIKDFNISFWLALTICQMHFMFMPCNSGIFLQNIFSYQAASTRWLRNFTSKTKRLNITPPLSKRSKDLSLSVPSGNCVYKSGAMWHR